MFRFFNIIERKLFFIMYWWLCRRITGGCKNGCTGCAELCTANAAFAAGVCGYCNYACLLSGCNSYARCDTCSGGGGCGSDLFLYFL